MVKRPSTSSSSRPWWGDAFSDYQRLQLLAVPVRGTRGAFWQFTWSLKDLRVRTDDILFVLPTSAWQAALRGLPEGAGQRVEQHLPADLREDPADLRAGHDVLAGKARSATGGSRGPGGLQVSGAPGASRRVPAIGLLVGPGAAGRAVTALDVGEAPADLGCRVGLPVGPRPAINEPDSACGMPYAPELGFSAVTAQPLSRSQSGSRHENWPLDQSNRPSICSATCCGEPDGSAACWVAAVWVGGAADAAWVAAARLAAACLAVAASAALASAGLAAEAFTDAWAAWAAAAFAAATSPLCCRPNRARSALITSSAPSSCPPARPWSRPGGRRPPSGTRRRRWPTRPRCPREASRRPLRPQSHGQGARRGDGDHLGTLRGHAEGQGKVG